MVKKKKRKRKDLANLNHLLHCLVRNIFLPPHFKQPASTILGIIRHVAGRKPPLIKLKSLIRGVIDVSIHYLLFKQWRLTETHTLYNNAPPWALMNINWYSHHNLLASRCAENWEEGGVQPKEETSGRPLYEKCMLGNWIGFRST